MCAEIHLRDGTRIENVGGLWDAGVDAVIDGRYEVDFIERDTCLCAVDVPETFKAVGWTYSAPENVYRIPFDCTGPSDTEAGA